MRGEKIGREIKEVERSKKARVLIKISDPCHDMAENFKTWESPHVVT